MEYEELPREIWVASRGPVADWYDKKDQRYDTRYVRGDTLLKSREIWLQCGCWALVGFSFGCIFAGYVWMYHL